MNENQPLDFVATGGNQHVFVARGCGLDDWVCKIPASFGRVLPWDHPRRLTRGAPRGRVRRMVRQLLSVDAPTATGARAPSSRLRLRDHVHSRTLQYQAARKFRRMLDLMEELAARDAADQLLPFFVERDQSVLLRVDGRTLPYRGPVLVQRRAEFRQMREVIDDGGWERLVEAQHQLWRGGVAVADVVRFTSWVHFEGRLCIADGDSLTTDLGVARSYVSASVLANEAAVVARLLLREPAHGSAAEYLAFMKSRINRGELERAWRADAAAAVNARRAMRMNGAHR
jgi:hypothetical protein